ncbi:hypothetical protein [Nostoc sp.]|uniref:hypothetical protein n=1 Tax=Nostoc sp. TaxID=1180 RepID=UPI002FFBE675
MIIRLHIEAAGEQGAGSKEEDLQVLPNHGCDAICRRNSLILCQLSMQMSAMSQIRQ